MRAYPFEGTIAQRNDSVNNSESIRLPNPWIKCAPKSRLTSIRKRRHGYVNTRPNAVSESRRLFGYLFSEKSKSVGSNGRYRSLILPQVEGDDYRAEEIVFRPAWSRRR